MSRRVLATLLAVCVTGLALWFLTGEDTLDRLASAVMRADFRALAAAMALSAAVQWLRAWRFALMTYRNLRLPQMALVRIAFQLNLFNVVLPFRLGEISYPLLMRRTFGEPLARSTGVLVLARLLDLATVLSILLGTAAALGLGQTPSGSLLLWGGAALSVLGALLAPSLGYRALKLSRRLDASRFGVAVGPALDKLGRAGIWLPAVGLSYAVWLVFGLLAMLAAASVVHSVPVLAAMLGAAAGNLAFALPINGIAGLGPSQAAWVLAVTRAGVPWDDAVVTAFALYGVVLTSALCFGGIAFLIGGRRQSDKSER